jgi:cobalt-zinc-cadmium efflux system outer membrane protein
VSHFPSVSSLRGAVAIFCLILGTQFPSLRAEPSPIRLTADSAVALAIKGNKELAAARFLVREAQGRARGAGILPNPELETEVAAGQDFEGRVTAGIMQRFPLTGRLRLERQLSDLDVRMAGLEVQEKEWQLTVAVRKAFYEFAAAREALAISNRQAEWAEAFAKSIAEGLDAGFRSKLDLQEATLAASTLQTKTESRRGLEIESSARLSALLGLSEDACFTIEEKLSLPRSIPAVRPIATRPDLELAEVALRTGEANISLSKATSWDDVGVGLFVEGERFRDDPTGIEPEALAGLKLSIPLPIWQSGAGRVAEKEAARQRMSAKWESLRFAAQNQILFAHRMMSLRYRSASHFGGEVLPAANEHVQENEAASSRGEVPLQAVFRARDRLAEIELSELEARKEYFLAHSEWLGALGESKTNP